MALVVLLYSVLVGRPHMYALMVASAVRGELLPLVLVVLVVRAAIPVLLVVRPPQLD